MKYIRKGFEDREDVTPEQIAQQTFEAEQVEKDTTIKTIYGDVLVTEGNYILTDYTGARIGITPIDLQIQYDKED